LVDRDRINEFRARFGLADDPDAFRRFRTRIVQGAHESVLLLLDEERGALEFRFAFRNGSRYVKATSWGAGGHTAHGIIEEFQQAESYQHIIERIQHLLWTFEELGYFQSKTRYSDREYAGLLFATKLTDAIQLSPGIDLRLDIAPGRAEIMPAGAPLLDESVDRSIQWLDQCPDVTKEFRQALAILAERREDQFHQAQDSLRFALEKLLKLLLRNNVPLEDQGKPLKEYLASKGLHQSLREVAVQIMILLSKQYQNAAVKHDNAVGTGEAKAWQAFEVEYIIYQHATLFRLLSEVAALEQSPANDSSTPTALLQLLRRHVLFCSASFYFVAVRLGMQRPARSHEAHSGSSVTSWIEQTISILRNYLHEAITVTIRRNDRRRAKDHRGLLRSSPCRAHRNRQAPQYSLGSANACFIPPNCHLP
jgi:hypothetical protein